MKTKLVLNFILLLLSFASVATASPVYLECTAYNEPTKRTDNYTVTLDENAQTVIFASDGPLYHGMSYTRPAQFTQTAVIFNWHYPDPILSDVVLDFRIDRVNLDFSSTARSTGQVDHGSCKIAATVKRQF